MSDDRYNEPSPMPVSDYGTAWITGFTTTGRVLHTVLKRRRSMLSLPRSLTLCGRKLDWRIPTESELQSWIRDFPLCKKCDRWMQ